MVTGGRAKTAIVPMLSVRNGVQAIAFFQAVFGAEILFQLEDGARSLRS